MSMNKDRFKDDIESAERKILIVSWIGIVSVFGLVVYTIWGI